MEHLLWIDVETTGLHPGYDELLEVYIHPTRLDATLTDVWEPFHMVLKIPSVPLSIVTDYVLHMHAANGLWAECRHSGNEVGNLRLELSSWAAGWRGYAGDEPTFAAGRSVNFDLRWLEHRLGEVYKELGLSHRVFDLSSIKMFTSLAGIESGGTKSDAHRAKDDVLADISLARTLIEAVT